MPEDCLLLFTIHKVLRNFTIWHSIHYQNKRKKGDDDAHRTSCKNCQTWRWFSVRFSLSLNIIKNLFYRHIGQNENRKAIEFFVILCGDVLLEVLSWGDRRRLTRLERIGRRFHWSVVKFFREMPFLRLNLELQTWYLFVKIKKNVKFTL